MPVGIGMTVSAASADFPAAATPETTGRTDSADVAMRASVTSATIVGCTTSAADGN